MLRDKEIELLPISEKDTEYIIQLRNNLEISNNFFSDPPLYDFKHKEWISKMKNSIDMIIYYNSEKVGRIYIYNIDYKNEKCEYGIALDPEYSGKGIAYEASKLLLNYVFSNLKIRKIYLELFSDNMRAKKLYEKIGFKQEGYFNDEIYKNGEFKDIIRMAYYKND